MSKGTELGKKRADGEAGAAVASEDLAHAIFAQHLARAGGTSPAGSSSAPTHAARYCACGHVVQQHATGAVTPCNREGCACTEFRLQVEEPRAGSSQEPLPDLAARARALLLSARCPTESDPDIGLFCSDPRVGWEPEEWCPRCLGVAALQAGSANNRARKGDS